jgi:transmembrane sensor
MNPYSDSSSPIPEQAADWLVELSDPGLDETRRRQFMSWLKRSPQHIEEFLAIAVLEQEIAEQPIALADILAEFHRAEPAPVEPLFGVAGTPVVEAPSSPRRMRHTGRRPGRRFVRWLAAASVGAFALLLTQFMHVDAPAIRHGTAIGEQRSVALADGSIVMLNTQSEVEVRIDRSTRHVSLLAGEAMFDVVADRERPFVVQAGNVSLRVLGTKFSVYRTGALTRVAVVDGTVQLVPDDRLADAVLVTEGETLVAGRDGVLPAGAGGDFETAVAWTERRLIFNAAPLAQVVHEFNRYNAVPLVVEDSQLAARPVTTVFNANDVGALVTFLELEPDVEVQHDDDAIRIRARD